MDVAVTHASCHQRHLVASHMQPDVSMVTIIFMPSLPNVAPVFDDCQERVAQEACKQCVGCIGRHADLYGVPEPANNDAGLGSHFLSNSHLLLPML